MMDGNPFLKSSPASSELDSPAADNTSAVQQDQYRQTLTQRSSLALNGEAEPDDHGEETEGHGRHLISSGNDTEENVTIISESMTVTSADEEKLLLLNRNTDLRRLNKELMKLNEEWDHIYRSTTMGLQEKISSLQQEVVGLNQHNERLVMKLEHEQSKREYYEQTLLQELRKNQHLQEYVRHLEGKIHRSSSSSTASERPAEVLNGVEVCRPPEVCEGLYEFPSQPPRMQYKGSSHSPPPLEPPGNGDRKQGNPRQGRSKQDSATLRSFKGQSDMLKEVQELKDQLETLKCQTQIYEADYKTEHKDRERMKNENSKLRRKEEELRQQMALQQEQLKVYEDDFRKERSDKQVLQRLLLKKAGPTDPVLVHRCNNEHERPPGERQGSAHRSGCAKHCERHGHKASECRRAQRPHQHQDAEVQASPFTIDYH
ncbi:TNFAIP3-interacting protein 3-like isoform X1 [Acipenser ruthenus]|uniref:TNFAIP3-interacting protein 3-like isoform X1 n=1 Tax=Acipenser ruthenus TaxID=7906 RepID=UPI00145B5931|nr:TNFAIP3-interacting protein 3-like isoform X1 [Acipenser ruthenus]XP_058857264.1 TNFAIP3-interacting protein 3-like isoform X1 [Acipenser ruthenus]XP_058857265.1 TNFAIP3-interacting protein 3-like isoform X1 [Acipenser ruthenus]